MLHCRKDPAEKVFGLFLTIKVPSPRLMAFRKGLHVDIRVFRFDFFRYVIDSKSIGFNIFKAVFPVSVTFSAFLFFTLIGCMQRRPAESLYQKNTKACAEAVDQHIAL